MNVTTLPLALASVPFRVGSPLFGSQWLALALVLGLIAVLLALVVLLGRWLAATHPEPEVRTTTATIVETPVPASGPGAVSLTASPTLVGDVPSEIVPVIVAAVAAGLGPVARVVSITPFAGRTIAAPSIEALMQEWSHEGRRQIYSSHKVR